MRDIGAVRMTFDRIALTLSGGGYRAAAFHLGVLRFLHRVGLLRNVRALSTASGGTIIGAFYTQCLARGIAFEEFDVRMTAFLRGVDVIDAALAAMPRAGKLIAAAADVYAVLVDGTLGEVQQSADHLDEISFNATDIEHGLAFRFVKTANRRVRSGNRENPLPNDVAASIRLADIVAASSCFPAAFEPMLFPDDFRLGDAKSGRSIALMDGGIYDNQGVDSLLLVRSRRREEIDAIIISDAGVNEPPLYESSEPQSRGFVRVWMVALGAGLLEVAAIASIVQLAANWRHNVMPIVAASALAFLVGWLWLMALRLKRSATATRPRPLLWRQILRLTTAELIDALRVRAESLIALTSRVFMKRVRALTYRRLFERPSTSRRTIANRITELRDAEEATDAMRALGARAASMNTTLWFSTEEELRDLIAAGEMTTCLNLLRHGTSGVLKQRIEAAWQDYSR